MPWGGAAASTTSGTTGTIAVRGSVPASANLPTDAARGDTYVTRDTGHLWIHDGTAFIDAGPIVGPAGPAPTFTSGNVTALPAGSAPTATVVKVAATTYRLDLGIPGGTGSGAGSVDPTQLSFRYIQNTAADTWTFAHPLPFEPGGIRIVDYSDSTIEWNVDRDYDAGSKTFTLHFPLAVRGEVVVS